MVLSFFLAKLMGLLMLIVGLAATANKELIPKIVKEISKNYALLIFSGFILTLFGLIIILSHNVWTSDWRMLITIMGWLILLKGLFRLFAPDDVAKFISKMNDFWFATARLICVIIGIYLIYIGFFAY